MEVPTGIGSLPEHLFGDILALLQSHEIAQAARVCRRWNSVANTPYLWYHLSFLCEDTLCEGQYAFTEVKPSKEQEVPWRKIVERAKGRVVSVELGCLSPTNISKLAPILLKKASSTLKHITWTASSDWGNHKPVLHKTGVKGAARKVLELAQACPQLASLEVMCGHVLPNELFTGGVLQSRKLQRFGTNVPFTPGLCTHLTSMLSQAKVVSILGAVSEEETYIPESWALNLLSNNSTLEELRVEHYSDLDSPAAGIATSLELKSLELLKPRWAIRRDVMLHAPNLRRLVAEARIINKLSVETTSNLSELHVYAGWKRCDGPLGDRIPLLGHGDTAGFQRIRGHTGAMTLVVGRDNSLTEVVGDDDSRNVAAIMQDLEPYFTSSEIVWPGLTDVTLYLADHKPSAMLPRLIKARSAGAQGASTEQYKAIAAGTATAGDFTWSGPPLCKKVTWHIHYYKCLDQQTVVWLTEQDSVLLYEPYHSY